MTGVALNNSLMRWLLDLDSIPADAETLNLAWQRPWPPWAWMFLVIGSIAFALWTYRRLAGRSGARSMLAGIRAALIILALVTISGPMLELPRESVEQDWVLMLVDRSESLSIADAEEGARRIRREDQLRSLVQDNTAVWSDLAAERQVVWLGFDLGAYDLSPETSDPVQPAFEEPDGRETRLASAIDQALQRAAARPISGVVVISDGRTTDPPDRGLLRRLQADAVPVFALPLGSADPIGDFAIRRVDAPRRAFVRDKVPIVVDLDRLGAGVSDQPVKLRLVDETSGETLDEQIVQPGEDDAVTLTATPALAGSADWRVEVETPTPDLIAGNNGRTINIDLIDRPLRVLFVEGYPRWEYRYLKNLLVREQSIESSVMLISADRDFAQEGNLPITRMPRSPEEFAEYDVIVLGDMPGTFFSPQQLEMIRDHVAERGAGLVWIAGPRSVPEGFAGTALADLLPMRGSLALSTIDQRVNMRPTELAEHLGVLQLLSGDGAGWPRELADPAYGWSQLAWAQRIDPAVLKPTAEVLGETVQRIDGDPLPLVVHMRYGAGQSLYVATDEIWRWRYGRGELLPEQFWVQLIRMLGRESLEGADSEVSLSVNPRRVEVDQPVTIDLRLLDARLVDPRRQTVTVHIRHPDGDIAEDVELHRVEGAEARYAATILADVPGMFDVQLADASLTGVRQQTDLEVVNPADELRRPEADHRLLEDLAEATGGRMLEADDLPALGTLLPNRSVRTLNPLTERIWDTPLFFALFLVLLAAEWIGRKIIKLP